MNTRQIQFNYQRMTALLLAGLILAAGLAWAGADASSSTFQPAQMAQDCADSPQPGQAEPSAAEVICLKADFSERESGLPSWSQLRSVKGSKPGVSPCTSCDTRPPKPK